MRTSDSSAPTVRLTARQQEILELIERAIAHTGAPPTRAEIATELGFKSANAAEEHLQALARKGMIELRSGTSRGIRLTSRSGGQQLAPGLAWASELPSGGMALPLIGRVAAGAPILAQAHIEAMHYVDRSLFQVAPDYLLKVRGQSMRDAGIQDGDLLAVQARQDARTGQIVVARLDEEVTVKRLRHTAQGLELQAANPDFAPIIVRPGQPCAIEGIVVGLIRTHTSF